MNALSLQDTMRLLYLYFSIHCKLCVNIGLITTIRRKITRGDVNVTVGIVIRIITAVRPSSDIFHSKKSPKPDNFKNIEEKSWCSQGFSLLWSALSTIHSPILMIQSVYQVLIDVISPDV